MRVVEIGRLQFSSQLEVEIGSKDWYLQLLDLAYGFFEYHVSERIWYVNSVIEQLLELDSTTQKSNSLFNNESINEIVETFLLSPDRELTRDVLIRHKHQPWETLVLKCEKLTRDLV